MERLKPTCIVADCTKPQVAILRCDAHRAALRRRNPVVLAAERDRKLRARYGISAEDADILFASQGYCCRICGKPAEESHKGLTIDHDALTGIVRGALCQSCNTGIGQFADDPVILASAIEYLNNAASLRLYHFEETTTT